MKILALESYYGGSHKAFIDGWQANSQHDWTLLTLPPYKWKWRMRHAAITFAEQLRDLCDKGQSWDLIFCSDMLNLAEFLALAPKQIQALPSIAYFHENQLTYPVRVESERDYQFAMTNMTTALAAKSVWFNSAFHRDSFLDALADFLKRMPDFQPTQAIDQIKNKSQVHPPGINKITPPDGDRKPGPARILWCARWEHDKKPEDFFKAMKILKKQTDKFRISVIGEQFRDVPEVFSWAKNYFADHIDNWGYQPDKNKYHQILYESDIIVSTADHEFFGISVVEAIAAGTYPMFPKRLSYPEILQLDTNKQAERFFYDGTVEDIAEKLTDLIQRTEQNNLWENDKTIAQKLAQRFEWSSLAPKLDQAAKNII